MGGDSVAQSIDPTTGYCFDRDHRQGTVTTDASITGYDSVVASYVKKNHNKAHDWKAAELYIVDDNHCTIKLHPHRKSEDDDNTRAESILVSILQWLLGLFRNQFGGTGVLTVTLLKTNQFQVENAPPPPVIVSDTVDVKSC
jgi:hypothetical protein